MFLGRSTPWPEDKAYICNQIRVQGIEGYETWRDYTRNI